MSDNVAAFERHMTTLAERLDTSIRTDMVVGTAKVYTDIIRASIASVTNGGRLGGVGKFNGGNRRGARVGLRSTIGTTSALLQATGPLHLIERDTSPHVIPRTVSSRRLRTPAGRLSHKRESTGRVLSGRKPLFFGGRWVMGPVSHPGTQGKHPFDRGVAASVGAGEAVAFSIFSRELKKVFPNG